MCPSAEMWLRLGEPRPKDLEDSLRKLWRPTATMIYGPELSCRARLNRFVRMTVNLISPFWFRILPLLLVVPAASGAVDFGRDVQPIFAGHCYECHGPEKTKGKLRLDSRSSAMREGEGAIVLPGKAAQSELYRRVTLPKGHEDIMPNRGEPLTRSQTDLIRDWINEGAVWPANIVAAKHWSYVVPVRAAAPAVKDKKWAKNDIDRFILARLEKE